VPAVPPGDLHDRRGQRLYLTAAERAAFLIAARQGPREVRTFCHVLHFTGCRISEALALTAAGVDLAAQCIVFETLKKRRRGVFRAVPVPAAVLDTLDLVHGVRDAQKRPDAAHRRLWPWCRMTAWRRLAEVFEAAGVAPGPHRCPKGLRHGFGVQAISAGVPLNLLARWMGHASLEVTAIYANALGEEQRAIAARMWNSGEGGRV